jgi:hypothetical protein
MAPTVPRSEHRHPAMVQCLGIAAGGIVADIVSSVPTYGRRRARSRE